MLKILVEGDSYGLPRFSKISNLVELKYCETYPYRLQSILQKNFGEEVIMVNRCRHANTSNTLISGEDCEIRFLNPDYCIIELGLTDLWPAQGRKIKPLQDELSGKDPWVDAETYHRNLQYFVDCLLSNQCVAIIVGIPAVAPWYFKKYSFLEKRIDSYNEKCSLMEDRKRIFFVDWNKIMQDDIQSPMIGSDGIHPSVYASNLLAQKIAEICEDSKGIRK